MSPAVLGYRPDWPSPAGALVSERAGGVSSQPYQSLNLGLAVGDLTPDVLENRRRFAAAVGRSPVWLHQVHGTRVVRVGSSDLDQTPKEADAAWTDDPDVACVVLVADCLPALFSSADGRVVAAAHAGWRGLANGVLEASLAAVCEGASCTPAQVRVWLGPCIGPTRFEVGADVLAAFGADPDVQQQGHFRARPRADGSARWLADLRSLAAERLRRVGAQVTSATECTVSDPSRFFSYRRDGVTGRFAAAVWCVGGQA